MIIQRTDGAVYAEDDSDHVVTTVVYEDSADQWYLDNNFNLISVGSNKKFIYNT